MMKNLKKMMTLLLAAAMMLALVSCGGETTKEPATLGEKVQLVFTENADQDIETLANTIIESDAIEFGGATMPVEPGFLMGFDAEITGFEKAVSFGPMIGTIPFMGYLFELADGADVDAFMATLEENANLRWNICTEAEQLIVSNEGNTVFFLMCPETMDAE